MPKVRSTMNPQLIATNVPTHPSIQQSGIRVAPHENLRQRSGLTTVPKLPVFDAVSWSNPDRGTKRQVKALATHFSVAAVVVAIMPYLTPAP